MQKYTQLSQENRHQILYLNPKPAAYILKNNFSNLCIGFKSEKFLKELKSKYK
jgi:hypothetical protein